MRSVGGGQGDRMGGIGAGRKMVWCRISREWMDWQIRPVHFHSWRTALSWASCYVSFRNCMYSTSNSLLVCSPSMLYHSEHAVTIDPLTITSFRTYYLRLSTLRGAQTRTVGLSSSCLVAQSYHSPRHGNPDLATTMSRHIQDRTDDCP